MASAAEEKETAPAAGAAPSTEKPTSSTPLDDLTSRLPALLSTASHSEIWSVSLTSPSPQRDLVLRKYLAAHKNNVSAAADGILATLKWRREFKPLEAVKETHDAGKFGGLGYVTLVKGEGDKERVVTWNVYGAVKDHKATFGNLDAFLRWRVGLMEKGVQALKLNERSDLGDDVAMVCYFQQFHPALHLM